MKPKQPKRVGKYEIGRTLGQGTFAKVKFARNVETGEMLAIKVIDKEKVLRHRMVDQMKREISIMKIVRHPNVVRLHEVLASQTKIYIVLEYVSGGELFDRIEKQGRINEDEARRYVQQLIDAVDFCHSKGVYHRDLKPENMLLDEHGNLKISDFGLSALAQQQREDGLLHTSCGTPNYVAPEVLGDMGYDGEAADMWSCGVIMFVLLAGFLPFDERDLGNLYRKIKKAEFSCPRGMSAGAAALVRRILDPNPQSRITFAEIKEDPWFKKGYSAVGAMTDLEADVADVAAAFSLASAATSLARPSQPQIPATEDSQSSLATSAAGAGVHMTEDEKQRQIEWEKLNAFDLMSRVLSVNTLPDSSSAPPSAAVIRIPCCQTSCIICPVWPLFCPFGCFWHLSCP